MQIGVTEACVLMYGFHLIFACLGSNESTGNVVFDLEKNIGIPYAQVTVGDLVGLLTFFLGI